MKWFRFYSEALNDPKVQSLPGDLFKFWVNLLCVTSQCDGALPSRDEIAFYLRVTCDEVNKKLDALIERGLIDVAENEKPHNWDKRQYKSNTSAQRMRKFRERKKAKSDELRDVTCDVTVTPSESESESESEKEKEKEKIYKKEKVPKRKRMHSLPEDFSVTLHHRELAAKNGWPPPEQEIEKFRNHHLAKGTLMADWDRAFYTWLCNAKEWGRQKQNRGQAPPATRKDWV